MVAAANTAASVALPETQVDLTEKMVAPYHDPNYAGRKGYDSGFLTGFDMPLPRPTKPGQLAALADGSHVIPYHHFSVVMDKQRRLPVFTASNLDYSAAAKKPEPGDYTRKGLSGLGPNDMELWFVDPRLPATCQLSDRFFTKDMGAFDRGHVVRREDVAWGVSYQEIRDAVGDTFHITNCTPQVAGFNRPDKDTNRGDLELFVAKQSESGRLSLFAGPVLASDDPIFSGVTDGGVLRVQIPRRYWKVVTTLQSGELAAFGFILDQNLDDVPLEFAVSPEWTPHMIALKDLERILSNLKFPTELKKADQASTRLGKTVRAGAGIELVSNVAPVAAAST
jgi:endonuclease G